MHVQQIDFERVIVHVYAHNIVVALPVTILVIKLLVRFATREAAKDIFKSVLVVPLDLIYIAFGILLAGVAGRIPTSSLITVVGKTLSSTASSWALSSSCWHA